MRLLFVHGWGGNGRIWKRQMDLSLEFKLEVPDLPGHGGAERWDRPDFGPGIRRVESVLRDGEPTLGIGWSLGGQLLLSMGGRIPSALKAIVTVGSAPSLIRRPGFDSGVPPERARRMRSEVERDLRGALKKFHPLNFSEEEKRDPDYADWLAVLDEASAGLIPEDVRICLEGLIAEDSRKILPEVRVPVLVVHGTSDAVIPFGAARHLAANLPDARLHEFPRAGHVPFITRAEEFNRLIRAFAREAVNR